MDRTAHALALIGELTSAPTVSKAVAVFERAIEPFGVRLYRTGVVANPQRGLIEAAIVSNWSEEWAQLYRGRRAFTFDPVVAAARRGEGFFWRDLEPSARPEGRELMRDAREIGMVDGFTVVRAPPGELKTTVNMAGDGLDWSELEQGTVSFVASALMSRMLHLRDVQLKPAVQALSLREAEILSHAAAGHADRAIAQALSLSYETVHFYWKSIRRKLGAADRANAVAVGLWSGQIDP
ncbi:MAG TPA: autoinducer binding domain-containing protein [Caulobacteraceae bacterium]|jgi:DNA-binding CsgD family transcriptional regulator|nr:autoinducer binding domain-containing protein [Caulobacteraceae bacterium]